MQTVKRNVSQMSPLLGVSVQIPIRCQLPALIAQRPGEEKEEEEAQEEKDSTNGPPSRWALQDLHKWHISRRRDTAIQRRVRCLPPAMARFIEAIIQQRMENYFGGEAIQREDDYGRPGDHLSKHSSCRRSSSSSSISRSKVYSPRIEHDRDCRVHRRRDALTC